MMIEMTVILGLIFPAIHALAITALSTSARDGGAVYMQELC